MNILANILTGKMQKIPASTLGVVNVRDIAKAHIVAWEMKHAQGRYIVAAETMTYLSIAQLIKNSFPESTISIETDNPHFKPLYTLSSAKCVSRTLEWNLVLHQMQSLMDASHSLISVL